MVIRCHECGYELTEFDAGDNFKYFTCEDRCSFFHTDLDEEIITNAYIKIEGGYVFDYLVVRKKEKLWIMKGGFSILRIDVKELEIKELARLIDKIKDLIIFT